MDQSIYNTIINHFQDNNFRHTDTTSNFVQNAQYAHDPVKGRITAMAL